jgi:hypothetical protein
LSGQALETMEEQKRLKALFNKPLEDHEKGSWKHSTKEADAAFFVPRKIPPNKKMPAEVATAKQFASLVTPKVLCKDATALVKDPEFAEKYKSKSAPLAMMAFATVVMKRIVSLNDDTFFHHFNGLTMEVPECFGNVEPNYHSIVGQKLLYVDWK